MTAPPATALTALRRADRAWCKTTADEPLDPPRLDHLAAALGGQPAAPADEVTELQAEVEQLREQLAAEHRDTLRAIGMLEAARRERDEALAEAMRLENYASTTNEQWEQHHQNDVLPYTSRLEDERDQAVSEVDRWALALVQANRELAEARAQPTRQRDLNAVDEHQAELDRIRAFEEQRREDLRVELWKHIDFQQRRAEQAEHQRNTWKGEYDRVVDDRLVELTEALEERDRARAELEQFVKALVDANARINESAAVLVRQALAQQSINRPLRRKPVPTIGEASDINTVLRFLLQSPRAGVGVPSEVEVLDAACNLADRSHKALSAGLTALDVHAAWPHRLGAETTT